MSFSVQSVLHSGRKRFFLKQSNNKKQNNNESHQKVGSVSYILASTRCRDASCPDVAQWVDQLDGQSKCTIWKCLVLQESSGCITTSLALHCTLENRTNERQSIMESYHNSDLAGIGNWNDFLCFCRTENSTFVFPNSVGKNSPVT